MDAGSSPAASTTPLSDRQRIAVSHHLRTRDVRLHDRTEPELVCRPPTAPAAVVDGVAAGPEADGASSF